MKFITETINSALQYTTPVCCYLMNGSTLINTASVKASATKLETGMKKEIN